MDQPTSLPSPSNQPAPKVLEPKPDLHPTLTSTTKPAARTTPTPRTHSPPPCPWTYYRWTPHMLAWSGIVLPLRGRETSLFGWMLMGGRDDGPCASCMGMGCGMRCLTWMQRWWMTMIASSLHDPNTIDYARMSPVSGVHSHS